ncbi:hypothetical protein DTL42_25260 [Bremerella cremea]|uniref:Uncharacterized protein n=1 Tax=Bremerella cremea TaxID=1031537 RepID=A0A368KLN1_9BACT|nr:hypothetical protein [Bremerella cremea]RCS40678.1 hypothetical protein DTL42_25260 [Bremerella cremea]
MIVFLLFAVINLVAGFACAVLLGYGPRPWYALFLPSGGDSLVRIEAIEAEAEATSEQAASPEQVVAAPPKPAPDPSPAPQEVVAEKVVEKAVAEVAPEVPAAPPVNEPVAELKPEPIPEAKPEVKAEPAAPQPVPEETPVAETKTEEKPPEQPAASEHELEDYLAGLRDEPVAEADSKPEVASLDDIEAMFANSTTSETTEQPETAKAPVEQAEDGPLDQDDIASLFSGKPAAKRKEEPVPQAKPAPEAKAESDAASLDDIEAMFANSTTADSDDEPETAETEEELEAAAEEELEDRPLDQDDIAALFK